MDFLTEQENKEFDEMLEELLRSIEEEPIVENTSEEIDLPDIDFILPIYDGVYESPDLSVPPYDLTKDWAEEWDKACKEEEEEVYRNSKFNKQRTAEEEAELDAYIDSLYAETHRESKESEEDQS